MSTQKPRVAVYCRVATADQFSLDRQRQSMLQFAKEKGYNDPVVYQDNGQKGTTLYRPAFEQLAGDMLSGQIQTVLIKDPSRISRDSFQFQEWLKKAKELGINVISQSGDIPDEMLQLINSIPPELREIISRDDEDGEDYEAD